VLQRRYLLAPLLALAMTVGACSGSPVDISDIPELPGTDTAGVRQLLATSDRPVVLNVWASWCIPCRSEAPLLDAAADAFAGDVRFIGLNVRDSQQGAREFIAEFLATAPIEHLFDRAGAVPPAIGGNTGVPLTFFFDADGTLDHLHTGVIDERGLAFQIDELLRGTG
jgi:thiol-disulfide isomerase/thioredoxin